MTYGRCSPSSLTYPLSVPHSTLGLVQTGCGCHVFFALSTSAQGSQRLTLSECNKHDYYKGALVSQITA